MGMKTNPSMMMKKNPSTKSLTKKIRIKSLTKMNMNRMNIRKNIMKKMTLKKNI